jgi:hypothetical protein
MSPSITAQNAAMPNTARKSATSPACGRNDQRDVNTGVWRINFVSTNPWYRTRFQAAPEGFGRGRGERCRSSAAMSGR